MFRAIQNPKMARSAMGYVQEEVALELSRVSGRTISVDMVSKWECGRRPVPEGVRRAYGTLLANALYQQLGRVIGVTLSIRSPWHVHCWRECGRCGQWFEIHDARQRFCCGRGHD